MARSGTKANGKLRPELKRELLADRKREFALLKDAHEILRLLGSMDEVLRALDAGEAKTPIFGAVVRALTAEIQSGRRLKMASDMMLYALAPVIEWKPLVGKWSGTSRRDFKQQAVVSLFDAIAVIQLSDLSDRELCNALQKAAHRGVMSLKKRERKEYFGRRLYKAKMANLRAEDRGGTRQRKWVRLRFEEEIRPQAVDTLFTWIGARLREDPRMAAWLAIVIEGKPVQEYVRERYVVNSDEECARLANLTRKQKERLTRELRCAINGDVEIKYPHPSPMRRHS